MRLSIFLAQVIGIYLIISSLALLLFKDRFKKLFKEASTNSLFLNFSGLLGVILGLLIVVSHNYWGDNWRTVVTIIGWITLVQGFVRVYFPDHFISWTKRFVASKTAILWFGWVWLVVGGYLTYIGFVW